MAKPKFGELGRRRTAPFNFYPETRKPDSNKVVITEAISDHCVHNEDLNHCMCPKEYPCTVRPLGTRFKARNFISQPGLLSLTGKHHVECFLA
jgi:hypothetical protein